VTPGADHAAHVASWIARSEDAFPVSVTFTEGAGVQSKVVTYTRGILDPEHIEFVLSGLVVVVAGLIAGAKPFVPPASRWAERGIQST